MEIKWVPLIWAAASLAKMLIALPAGAISDRIGRRAVLIFGLCLRIAILIALAAVTAHGALVWFLFLLYSASLAISEPAERALVGDQAVPELRGTVFGLYHLAGGLLALPGAFLFGAIWEYASSTAAFLAAGTVTGFAMIALVMLLKTPRT